MQKWRWTHKQPLSHLLTWDLNSLAKDTMVHEPIQLVLGTWSPDIALVLDLIHLVPRISEEKAKSLVGKVHGGSIMGA